MTTRLASFALALAIPLALPAAAVAGEDAPLRSAEPLATRAAGADSVRYAVRITDNNLVLVRKIIVLDSNVDSAASLNPAKNTLINQPPSNGGGNDSGGGGSTGLAALLGLALLLLGRRVRSA